MTTTRNRKHPRRRAGWLAVAATLALAGAAAGCGDDDEDAATDTTAADDTSGTAAEATSGDLTAYCDAALALETAPAPDVDFATATPEEQAAALRTWAADTMRPLADEAVALVPDEVADEADVASGALDELAATGDPATFESPEVVEAQDALHAHDLDACGWERRGVTATNYAFGGLPAELAAGPTSFELSNEAEEVHELLILRKADGVTETAEELLALPEEEAMSRLTPLGEPAFAPPGEGSYAVVDLEPGDYVVACFVPTGMTSTDGPPPADAPPHAVHGMVAEFTVA